MTRRRRILCVLRREYLVASAGLNVAGAKAGPNEAVNAHYWMGRMTSIERAMKALGVWDLYLRTGNSKGARHGR